MSLISSKKFAKAIGLNKFPLIGNLLGVGLMRLMSIQKVNKLYSNNSHLSSPEFEKGILNDLNITYYVDEKDLKRIPKDGPFVVVSNHPLGGVDGLILLKLFSEIRPDFKIIANFILNEIKPLQPRIFAVNPFADLKNARESAVGMRGAYKHLLDGNCLGVFPAGEVSHKDSENQIRDIDWQLPVMKLIKKANVPIIPMYIHSKNSNSFYRLQKLHPRLQTAMLPREVFIKRKKPIQIRIGKPIDVEQQQKYSDIESFTEFIRKKTYLLSLSYEKKPLQEKIKEKIPKRIKKIAPECNATDIINEINLLKQDQDKTVLVKGKYQIFFTKANLIPNVLHEIGRLREVTFRAIGEGSMKEVDLDKYDKHYHHLILWDNQDNKIAGAYRMGLGSQIYKEFGSEGFYICQQFNFDKEIQPFFSRCIDMGRAFIVQEYQQKPLPLYLLWNGIIHIAIKNPEHKYLLGGVSISNKFANFTKSIMIDFVQSHYYDEKIAKHISPKCEFKYKVKDEDKELVLGETDNDISKLDKIIEELEPEGLRMPVLIKKYIKQNAKVIGFSVDPKFNNAMDMLMYIKVSDIPESTLKPVLEYLNSKIDDIH